MLVNRDHVAVVDPLLAGSAKDRRGCLLTGCMYMYGALRCLLLASALMLLFEGEGRGHGSGDWLD